MIINLSAMLFFKVHLCLILFITISLHYKWDRACKNRPFEYKNQFFSPSFYRNLIILSQAHAGLWPAHAWFLKIISVQTSVRMCVCLCVCVPTPRLLITSGDVVWYGLHMIAWLNKLYSCYIATVVIIINGPGLGIGTHHRH